MLSIFDYDFSEFAITLDLSRFSKLTVMKIQLQPLYSQLNPGLENCPLGCKQQCIVSQKAPTLKPPTGSSCPLSSHQAKTCAEVIDGSAEIIFNTSATGDGKSLGAYLPGLINPKFRMVSLYPTIELTVDQERQLKNYCQWFGITGKKQIDSLYGAELSRRAENSGRGGKFNEISRVLMVTRFILANPDIFQLVIHGRYYHPANEGNLLALALAQYPTLYLLDEFHIFGVHQEAAILNSLILIRNTRQKKRPIKVLFTSATPKPRFIDKLKQAGFRVKEVSGVYHGENSDGYRQIAQPVELEFVELKDTDCCSWLSENSSLIKHILLAEGKGRGLIIVNSVAVVSQVVHRLSDLFGGEVVVLEISGRVDGKERKITRQQLDTAEKPVLIVATSAVDVGVDFDIHLLIFEASDSATFIQRLGRLGRHQGFNHYQAFALIPGWMRWIVPQLRKLVEPGESVDRSRFREEIIEQVFNSPQEHEEYRNYWGGLQAQGMLYAIEGGNVSNKWERKERATVTQDLRDKITQDLRKVYGERLDKKRGHWLVLGKEKTGQVVQQELLRFRGGSDLQAAVWEVDKSRFYSYDLLRLLPHVEIEVIDRKTFLENAVKHQHSETEFPENYTQIYLKVNSWLEQRYDIELDCELGTDELTVCTLTLIDTVSIEGHPQSPQLRKHLSKNKLLAFLVPLSRQHPTIWDIKNILRLNPNFGLYLLTDADEESYACAFNQDALLLEALKWKLKRCQRVKAYVY
ncbi:CRISPR-associated helicase, Cyano-type [Calothrix parasitica NIES-267]|uniref:CRISPR-associated helicase, Cyano-type n=1 Tax=Calothrix parasitica NIES-267 TaxID=1973488 RepID=A0A1Z4LRK9_9CYAN|nr:CRISPR-associated helicase, Cyano-type [Calothrix parasitica NIES-267]